MPVYFNKLKTIRVLKRYSPRNGLYYYTLETWVPAKEVCCGFWPFTWKKIVDGYWDDGYRYCGFGLGIEPIKTTDETVLKSWIEYYKLEEAGL